MSSLALPPPHLPIGLVQGVLLGGAVGGLVVARGARVVWTAASARRRRGLFLVRRPARQHRCPRCAGFRIAACDLCSARGLCDYRKRYKRVIPCPRCVLRRFVRCSACAGTGLRERGVLRRAAAWVEVALAPAPDSTLGTLPGFGERAAGLGAGLGAAAAAVGVLTERPAGLRAVLGTGSSCAAAVAAGGRRMRERPALTGVPAPLAPLVLAMLGHRMQKGEPHSARLR